MVGQSTCRTEYSVGRSLPGPRNVAATELFRCNKMRGAHTQQRSATTKARKLFSVNPLAREPRMASTEFEQTIESEVKAGIQFVSFPLSDLLPFVF